MSAPAEHPVDVVGHGNESSPDGAEAIGDSAPAVLAARRKWLQKADQISRLLGLGQEKEAIPPRTEAPASQSNRPCD